MLYLRQVCLAARNLAPAEAEIAALLDLEPAYRDPSVGQWGLENAVFPVGSQFLEVVAPVQPGTPAGRFLDRRGGDAGYMVILQTDDQPAFRARAQAAGIRTAFEFTAEADGYSCWQLHPRDTGGAFLEIDSQRGDDPEGDWHPAGHDWRRHCRTGRVRGVTAVTFSSPEPEQLARRWAEVLDRPLRQQGAALVLPLDNAELRFRPAGPGDAGEDAMAAIALAAGDAAAVRAAAAARGRAGSDGTIHLNGLQIELQHAG